MNISNESLDECRYRAAPPVTSGGLYIVVAYLVPCLLLLGLTGNFLILVALNAAVNKQKAKANTFLSAKAVVDFGFEFLALLHNLNVHDAVADSDSYSQFYFHVLRKSTYIAMNWLIMSSTWFAAATTFERMYAVGWPLKAIHELRKRRLALSILFIATVCLLLNIYPYFWLKNVTFVDCERPWRHVYASVGPLSNEQPALWYYGYFSRLIYNILASVVPVLLLFVFNSTIIWHLRHRRRSLNRFTEAGYNIREATEQLRVSTIVFTITVSMATFLLPSTCVVLYEAISYQYGKKSRAYRALVHGANLSVVCGKVVDFFLYCLVSSAFRHRLVSACRRNESQKSSNKGQYETLIMKK